MKRIGILISLFLLTAILLTTGCTVTSGSSAVPSGTSIPVQTSAIGTPVVAGALTTTATSEVVVFEGPFTMKSGYQTIYDKISFEDHGYQYLYPGDRFKISVTTNNRPVNILVIDKTDELKFNSVEPEWNTALKPDQWDYSPLVPAFSKSNVLNEDMTFVVKQKSTYFLIIDPRFASGLAGWKGSQHDDVQGTVRVIKF